MKTLIRFGACMPAAAALLSCSQNAPPPTPAGKASPPPAPAARKVAAETMRKIEAAMVPIPGGVLPAGYRSDFVVKGSGKKDSPVEIAPFKLGRHEVTREEWSEVMDGKPADDPEAGSLPVAEITWEDAQEFVAMVNQAAGAPVFRLPTAAEWAHACRAGVGAGKIAASEAALSRIAWWGLNSGGRAHPVELLEPNAWGLYDTLGNVAEWCADESEPLEGSAMRPIAGGNFVDENLSGHSCRVSGALAQDGSEPYTGFRLARSYRPGEKPPARAPKQRR